MASQANKVSLPGGHFMIGEGPTLTRTRIYNKKNSNLLAGGHFMLESTNNVGKGILF